MRKLLLAALLTAAATGCPAPRQQGQTITHSNLDVASAEQQKKLVAEGDALWAERLDEQKLRGAIAKWEAAVAMKGDDYETYQKLARGNYLLADGFLSFDPAKVDEFLATHEKGMQLAEKGLLAISPDFEKQRRLGAKMENAVEVLNKDAVPLLYWYATNLGKWAKFKGIEATLAHKDTIFKTVTRVEQLDPEYFYGGADRYFGGYYAVAPSFAGGDVAKSAQYFEAAVKRAPNYLATHVLIAELLAPKKQDRDLYTRELKLVIDTPVDVIPELVPEHTIEKKKAEKLLKEIEDKFE